jgi:putative intracellular protease/amidase
MDDYSAIYMPGGHGAMWDFPDNKDLQGLILNAYENKKPITSVCHGPAAFVNVMRGGKPLIAGVKLNSFTDAEEKAGKKDGVVPFLLESKLRACGADFKGAPKGAAICVRDGLFITGQNPPSARPVAEALRDYLRAGRAQAAA